MTDISISNIDAEIDTLFDERERLEKRIKEINTIILKKQEEKRQERITYLLENPIDDEMYMYALHNFSKFQQVVDNELCSISYEVSGCGNVVMDKVLYEYKKSPFSKDFKEWLDSAIFQVIIKYSRKSDAESYIFNNHNRIHRFLQLSS